MAVDEALLIGLRETRDRMLEGWEMRGGSERRVPDQVWIDAKWKTDLVMAFCRESNGICGGPRFRPAQGFGSSVRSVYRRPKEIKGETVFIGSDYHVVWDKARGIHVVQVNADAWKSRLHQGLSIGQMGEGASAWELAGSVTFFEAMRNEHLTFVKHLTAEREIEKAGKRVWTEATRNNHFLDASYNALCALSFCAALAGAGARRKSGPKPGPGPAAAGRGDGGGLRTPDGRAFLVTER
jgi:hypothetical protein